MEGPVEEGGAYDYSRMQPEEKQQQPTMQSSEATATTTSPLKCRYCDKTFLYSAVMMCHMRKHTSERANKHKISQKGFPDRSSLTVTESPGRESNELAENLHMQNPMQWLPPLENPEIDQSAEEDLHDRQHCQRLNNTAVSGQTSTSTGTWQNLRQQPVVDLTSASRDASTERAGLIRKESINRILSRMPHESKGYRYQPRRPGILCIEKKARAQEQGSINPDVMEKQPKTTTPGTSQGPPVAELDSQATPLGSQQGHFSLCPNGRALKCNYCSFMCRRTCGRMIKHLQIHGIRSRNQCKACGLGFLNKCDLQDHQKVCSQSSLAPQCSECGKTFSFRSLLRQHMNTHINKKPYKCQHCPMTFNSASLCQLHVEKQHLTTNVTDQVNLYQCTLCTERFENSADLDSHFRQHIVEKSYKCTFCSMSFSTSSARYNHIRNAHRFSPTVKNKDEAWLRACLIRPVVTSSSGIPSSPASSPLMAMPVVVSVSSQSMGNIQTNVVDLSSLNRPKSVDGPSELTAGSPERIDDGLDTAASALVYMRKELNPKVTNDERGVAGPSVLRSWSVSDSSDLMASSESAVVQVEEGPIQPSGNWLMFVKKEVQDKVTDNESEHHGIVSAGRSSVESGNINHNAEGILPRASDQQLEPTSTARENEDLNPIEVYPVQYQQYINQNPSRINENHHRLLDANRVVGSPSPDGSYGRTSTDNTANPESPCGATSTRRSLDAQDTFHGSHRCNYCDIAFGDPIMHYLHMGWHVTGDPWKCNGCGQECLGKVDFFLHLYKVSHN